MKRVMQQFKIVLINLIPSLYMLYCYKQERQGHLHVKLSCLSEHVRR